MKPQIALTPDQMHELQSLGLDCSDASMAWISLGGTYNSILVLSTQANEVMQWYDGAAYQSPAYTLEDIICKVAMTITWVLMEDKPMKWRVYRFDEYLYADTPLEAAFAMLKYAIKLSYPNQIKRL